MSDRPYSRVYWSVRSDPKFAHVYADDARLSTWLRLLIAADAMWPEPADIPGTCRRGPYQALVAAGLVDDLGSGLYRIHGLDAERGERSEKARASVSHRYDRSTPVVRPYIDGATSRAEPSTSQAEPSPAREDDLWRLYSGMTRATTIKPAVMDWLERLETTYTGPVVAAALVAEREADPAIGTLLSRTEKRCEREAKAAETERERAKRSARTMAAMTARRLEAWRHTGKWDPAWGPEPTGGRA